VGECFTIPPAPAPAASNHTLLLGLLALIAVAAFALLKRAET
jgi:hypothetical protein